MKPNFALSLFFDKVELLHRSGDEWSSIGEVAFDAEDLPGALSSLRKKALTHDPAGLRTKLILPDEQVKFLSLPEADADETAVREALVEATPYSLDELVFEHTSDGRRTHIAAVAKETLEEAEAFAVEHRFAPVSIVAQTVVGRFDGEPFFGETKAAAGLIGPDDHVERDNPPAALAPPTEPEAPPEPDPTPEPKAKTPEPVASDAETMAAHRQEAQEGVSDAETKAKSVPAPGTPTDDKATDGPAKPAVEPTVPPPPSKVDAPVEATDPTPPAPKSPPKPKSPKPPSTVVEPPDAPLQEPVFSSRARSAAVEAGTIQQAMKSVRSAEPATETKPRTVPQTVPPRPAPGTPPAAVAERLARITRSNITADRLADMPPADVAPVPNRPKGRGAAAMAPPVTGTSPAIATSPKAIGASLKPQDVPAGKTAGLFASRRNDDFRSDRREAAAATAPAAAAATEGERKGMTVFDERAASQTGGKPRFFLLILMAILLIFMAAVAAWASLFTEEGLAGLFGRGDDSELADPIEIAAPSDTTPLTPLAAPDLGGDTALVLPEASDPVDAAQTAPEQLASAAVAGDAGLDPVVTAIPDPPAEEQAALDPPVVTPDTPPGTVLSPAEADRFYAATGVWLRAPRLPLLPSSQDLGTVTRTSVDSVFDSPIPPAELPEIGVLFPDTPLATQIDPPAADVVFPRDDRGLLLATADGTVSPYGMLIYAGLPDVVPPTRPGTPAPEVVADPVEPAVDPASETEVAETAETPLDPAESVAATLEALIAETLSEPALPADEATPDQPETVAEAEPADVPRDDRGLIVASADGTVTDGLIVYAGLPDVIPPTRPDTTVPNETIEELVADVADTAESQSEPLSAGGVSFDGLRPAPRPDTLDVPEIPASFAGPMPVVRPESLTEASTPPEEIEPEIDDTTVAATLAAIVAAAPDPLATATQQAVASAIIPEARPRNFDRVVAAAQARQASTAAVTTTTTTTTASAPTTVSAAAAQPTGPVPQSVASAATIEGAINLRQINLIGVFGRPNDRRALVRLGNGSFVRVGVGDALDGGQVTAIGDNVINYVKRGRTIALGVPG